MEELAAMRVERDAGQGDRGRRHWTNGRRIKKRTINFDSAG